MAAEIQSRQASSTRHALRTIDFSNDAMLKQASTMLRRAWLLRPPLSDEELADPTTVQKCLRSMCEAIGNGITDDPEVVKWDHELWRKHTHFQLLEPTVVAATAEPLDLVSVVSPWREEIYDIYRHVFSDLWRALFKDSPEDERGLLGRYDPVNKDAVSLVVLPAGNNVDRPAFTTDTFVFPVWLNSNAHISFSASGVEHVWAAGKKATWTTGLWLQAGHAVTLTTEMKDVGMDTTGIAAVFVTGHCGEGTGMATERVTAALAVNGTSS